MKMVFSLLFQCLKQQKLSPVWFSEDECFTVKEKKKNEVYIFDVFTGEAFEHITSLGSRLDVCIEILKQWWRNPDFFFFGFSR